MAHGLSGAVASSHPGLSSVDSSGPGPGRAGESWGLVWARPVCSPLPARPWPWCPTPRRPCFTESLALRGVCGVGEGWPHPSCELGWGGAELCYKCPIALAELGALTGFLPAGPRPGLTGIWPGRGPSHVHRHTLRATCVAQPRCRPVRHVHTARLPSSHPPPASVRGAG